MLNRTARHIWRLEPIHKASILSALVAVALTVDAAGVSLKVAAAAERGVAHGALVGALLEVDGHCVALPVKKEEPSDSHFSSSLNTSYAKKRHSFGAKHTNRT